jgi:hypothetical protein
LDNFLFIATTILALHLDYYYWRRAVGDDCGRVADGRGQAADRPILLLSSER